jgi:LysM repeat protein
MGTYIVKPGDTLTAISKSIRGDPEGWRDSASANALKNPNRLQVGQVLEIDGYEPEQVEGIPEPPLNPRREYSQSRGNAFGAPPVREMEVARPSLPSARAAGAEEMVEEAIPETPEAVTQITRTAARTDLTPELMDRVRQRQGVGPFPARPETIGRLPTTLETAYADPSRAQDDAPFWTGLNIRDGNEPPVPDVGGGPDFDWAAAGAEFDPPTGAKIAEMMKRFKDRPELVDQVLQQLMEAEAGS